MNWNSRKAWIKYRRMKVHQRRQKLGKLPGGGASYQPPTQTRKESLSNRPAWLTGLLLQLSTTRRS